MAKMKKTIALVLAIIMMVSLCACGQSKAARTADDAIAAIGNVTLESESAIENAESLVEALSEEDYKQVEGLEVLAKARETYETLSIEELINSIGTVSLNSQSAIKKARKAYANANESVKERVSNYSLLETAENQLLEMKIEIAEKSISDIGTVTLDSLSAIEMAEEKYNALDSSGRKKVSNYDILVDAKKEYNRLLKQNNKQKYNSALSRMTIEKDEVTKATFYVPKRMPYYINSRCEMLPYIGINSNNHWMKLRFNYAGDDWVFFKQATIAVDDDRYYKSFEYFDITHDNGGGMVGEMIDIDPTSDDIKMLRKIVASKKTIVRFEGDDFHYDYTMTDSDKSAIKDILTIFDYLEQ